MAGLHFAEQLRLQHKSKEDVDRQHVYEIGPIGTQRLSAISERVCRPIMSVNPPTVAIHNSMLKLCR
jgi:hypothetical protein